MICVPVQRQKHVCLLIFVTICHSIFISTAFHPEVDEEIDYLSSVIAKQQMSEVKQPGLNYLFFKSVVMVSEVV